MTIVLRTSAVAAAIVCCSVSSAFAVESDDTPEQIVVTGSRVEQPISAVIGSVTVITRDDIERRQVQSVQDLLRGEAGIDISNQGGLGKSSSIFLRGANASQTLILVDGVRLGSATLGTTSIESIPIDQIERVEIVRGPRASLYGSDAMGGVIQLFTRKVQGVNLSVGYGSHNTQNYSAGFGEQLGQFRFGVNAGYLQSNGFDSCSGDPVTFSGCGVIQPDDDGYRNSSVTAHVGYAFGERVDLEAQTLYSQSYTEFDGFYDAARNRQSAPTLKLRVQALDSLAFTATGGITEDKNENFLGGISLSHFDTRKDVASLQTDWQPSKQHTVSLGVDYLRDRVDSDTAYPVNARRNTGVFLQYLGRIAAHEISASARHDDNQQFGSYNTGGLGWKWFVLDRALAINAGWGKAFHAPSFNDLYYPNDGSSAGNPDLLPERSRSYELGLSGTHNWLSWSLQAFHTNVEGLIDWTPDASFFYSPQNLSSATMRGIEATTTATLAAWRVALNYTYLDPRSVGDVNDGRVLPRRARQSGRIDVSYNMGPARLSSTVNVIGPRYDDLSNTARLGGYSTVDFASDVELSKALTLQVKLANFFDRRYETARYYNQDGRAIYLTLRYQAK